MAYPPFTEIDLNIMSTVLSFIAILAYLGSTMLVARHNNYLSNHLFLIRSVWLIALLAHAGTLLLSLLAMHSWGGILTANSFIAFVIVTTLFFSCLRQPLEIMAIFLLPFAALSLLASIWQAAFIGTASFSTNLMAVGIKTHIIFSLLSYSILLFSAVLALFLLIKDKRVHQGTSSWLSQRLPALEQTEVFLFHLLSVGFVLLTIALISGWIYVEDLFVQHLAHKTILSAMAWIVYATLLIGHWLFGWRGSQFIRWLWVATGLLIIAYLGSSIVLHFLYSA